MTHADPVWVNVEDDESSVASDRIIDQEDPSDDGGSGMDDELSDQEDPQTSNLLVNLFYVICNFNLAFINY